jgi:hypothetical protein
MPPSAASEDGQTPASYQISARYVQRFLGTILQDRPHSTLADFQCHGEGDANCKADSEIAEMKRGKTE